MNIKKNRVVRGISRTLKVIFTPMNVVFVLFTLYIVCTATGVIMADIEEKAHLKQLQDKVIQLQKEKATWELNEREKYINGRLDNIEEEIERATMFIADTLDTYNE